MQDASRSADPGDGLGPVQRSATAPGQPRVSRRRPTIDDVAERCGVAPSTVSRALSRPGRIGAATRERILAVAAEMGYRPNPIARALPSGRTNTLALVVPDITNPFFGHIIRGAEHAATDAGYTLVLADTNESPKQEATKWERLRDAVDGYVLASSRLSDSELLKAYEQTPLVVLNRPLPPLPAVLIDSAPGIRAALEHLASLGHRRIGYLAGPATSWSNDQRWSALVSASSDIRHLQAPAPTVAGGEAAADAVLGSGVTAVVTFNDLLAIGLLRECRARGIDVPGRLSIVGCDDIFGAELCTPALTTLTAPVQMAGRAAVELLLRTLPDPGSSPNPPNTPGTPDVPGTPDTPDTEAVGSASGPVRLPTRLTIRQSTAEVDT